MITKDELIVTPVGELGSTKLVKEGSRTHVPLGAVVSMASGAVVSRATRLGRPESEFVSSKGTIYFTLHL